MIKEWWPNLSLILTMNAANHKCFRMLFKARSRKLLIQCLYLLCQFLRWKPRRNRKTSIHLSTSPSIPTWLCWLPKEVIFKESRPNYKNMISTVLSRFASRNINWDLPTIQPSFIMTNLSSRSEIYSSMSLSSTFTAEDPSFSSPFKNLSTLTRRTASN